MGKACLYFGGAAMTMLGSYYAASAISNIPPVTPVILFVAFGVFATLFLLIGAVYIFNLSKKHLRPLKIADNAQCTYLTVEKELQINWVVCDYSASSVFDILCLAHFGKQAVNIRDGSLVVTRDPKAECINGTRMVVSRLARNVEVVEAPEKCLLEIKMKPHGSLWHWRKKSIEVKTLLVKH